MPYQVHVGKLPDYFDRLQLQHRYVRMGPLENENDVRRARPENTPMPSTLESLEFHRARTAATANRESLKKIDLYIGAAAAVRAERRRNSTIHLGSSNAPSDIPLVKCTPLKPQSPANVILSLRLALCHSVNSVYSMSEQIIRIYAI